MKKSIRVFIVVSAFYLIAFFGTLLITKYVLENRSIEDRYTKVDISQVGTSYQLSDTPSVPSLPDIGAIPLSNGCSANLTVTKTWIDRSKGPTYQAAEYIIDFRNDTENPFTDWQLTFCVPEGSIINDSWNGNFIEKNGIVIVKSESGSSRIKPGGSRSIGFVMFTDASTVKVYPVPEMNIMFHQEFLMRDSLAVKIAVFTLVIYVLGALLFFVSKISSYRYKLQSEHDHKIIVQALKSFSTIIDAKDEYTRGHSLRVAVYSKELARRLNMSVEEQQRVFYIALLHDIGKIGIPDAILCKPGALTDTEREQIKRHVVTGGDILKDFTSIEGIEDGARYHHERYDGMGYCEGLCGTEIPLVARIIAVADAFDAMSSARCYRLKSSMAYIILELRDNFGKQFDPVIAQHMLDMISDKFAPVDETSEEILKELQ